MVIEKREFNSFVIVGAQAFDPITVLMRTGGGGAGQVILECAGNAYSASFGSMGSGSIEKFLIASDDQYLAEKLSPTHTRLKPSDRTRLQRMVGVVRTVLIEREEQA